ncbi:MAG: ribbon-helix-helix domain-containing protein [Terriglobia bacterium]
MKVKTSITLSEDVLKSIDRFSKQYRNRSDFIETASKAFIVQVLRETKNAKDLDMINRRSHRLNEEAEDVLTYAGAH